MRRLAYLFPAFPVLHQTFTLGEVLGLQRKGYDLRLISLKPALRGRQQPEALDLIDQTHYCPRLWQPAVLGALARAALRRPGDLVRLFAFVFSAWRGGRSEGARRSLPPAATFGLAERIDIFYSSSSLMYLLKSLLLVPTALYLAEHLEREGIRHVHSHWATYPTTVAMLMKRWSGMPYSFSAHAYDIYMIGRMLPAKIANATFVVTCAEANRRHLGSYCSAGEAGRVHVNYHGADIDRFVPVERVRGARFCIMSCGWLKEYKGFHYLLDALALLTGRGIDAVVELAGDGPQRDYLERQARRLGISDRLVIHGYVDHSRLIDLYRGADAVALPSVIMGRYGRQDVIPNVLAEAMAAGVPVVASNVAGIPELIDDGDSGLLVPERNAGALADALESLWRSPEDAERMAVAARAKIERIWDRDKNLDDLARIIDAHVPAAAEGGP